MKSVIPDTVFNEHFFYGEKNKHCSVVNSVNTGMIPVDTWTLMHKKVAVTGDTSESQLSIWAQKKLKRNTKTQNGPTKMSGSL